MGMAKISYGVAVMVSVIVLKIIAVFFVLITVYYLLFVGSGTLALIVKHVQDAYNSQTWLQDFFNDLNEQFQGIIEAVNSAINWFNNLIFGGNQ